MIKRLLFCKMNRAIAREETARIREEKQAAEQAIHDENRNNFLRWAEQVGDEHPLAVQTAMELEKVNNSLSLTQATKARRVNAIFSNAWSLAETEYNATPSAPPQPKQSRGKTAALALGAVVILAAVCAATTSTKDAPVKVEAAPAHMEIRKAEPPVEIRKAEPVEIRKAIPVNNSKLTKQTKKVATRK
jgi:hypothetical protein